MAKTRHTKKGVVRKQILNMEKQKHVYLLFGKE